MSQENILQLKAANVDLHRPEEGGSLHSLFERCDPDLGDKQYSPILSV